MTDLNELAQRVHQANIKWWQDPVTKQPVERNKGELLMLVITELAEACEGERKNLMDDKLPHRKMAEVEMADAKIRLLDFAAGYDYYLHSISDKSNWTPTGNKGDELLCICSIVCQARHSLMDLPFTTSGYLSCALEMINDYCERRGYDLDGAFEEKMAYNATREDHKHEARLQAGGKQW